MRGLGLWKAKIYYRFAARLPASFHGVDRHETTMQLLQQNQRWAEEYSAALQACLEGERPVHAAELNHPLMMWNAVWKVLNKRLLKAMPWQFRKELMRQNMILLEQPGERQLWGLVDRWMQTREQADKIQERLETPLMFKEHISSDWTSGEPGHPERNDQ